MIEKRLKDLCRGDGSSFGPGRRDRSKFSAGAGIRAGSRRCLRTPSCCGKLAASTSTSMRLLPATHYVCVKAMERHRDLNVDGRIALDAPLKIGGSVVPAHVEAHYIQRDDGSRNLGRCGMRLSVSVNRFSIWNGCSTRTTRDYLPTGPAASYAQNFQPACLRQRPHPQRRRSRASTP